MKKLLNTILWRICPILLILAAICAGSVSAGAETASDGKKEEASAPQAAAAPGTLQLQRGSSNYSVSIPNSYRNGEVTIEELQANMVAYYYSPYSDMDFDIYQFPRPDPEMSLEEYTKKSADDFNGNSAHTRMINGIEVGTYLSREFYNGIEYDVMAALIEDGDDYVEVVFWLDGEIAVRQADRIVSSLRRTDQ